ncbi:hypothetical protein GGR53DRAFT_508408 [Hypoxylon sp. FL1150]|nr:hypothetical protein GGR53DRAFT_508408 [Hypoxylon sp. FL1150]
MTLMFVMISPLEAHWPTSKSSLKIALTAQSAKKASIQPKEGVRARNANNNNSSAHSTPGRPPRSTQGR